MLPPELPGARLRCAHRKGIRRTFPTKTAAKLWRADADADADADAVAALRQGDTPSVALTGQTVREALDALTAGMADGTILDRSGRRYRPATIRSYQEAIRKYLAPKLGHLRLADVRRADCQRVVDELHAAGLTGSTVRNKLDPLRVVYRRAIQDDVVSRNPAEKLRLPALASKPRQVANPDRVGILLDALPPGERAPWATAFYAELRVGELRALRWCHVDFDACVIRVQAGRDDAEGEQATKTTAGERTVPLIGRLPAACRPRPPQARHRPRRRRPVLRAHGHPGVRALDPARPCPRRVAAAGLEALTPHEARHTCASYLAAAGLTPKEAQTAMGHADIRTTMNIYAKAVPGWEGQAAAKLDAYLDPPRATVDPLNPAVRQRSAGGRKPACAGKTPGSTARTAAFESP